jgi:hypothetical protein
MAVKCPAGVLSVLADDKTAAARVRRREALLAAASVVASPLASAQFNAQPTQVPVLEVFAPTGKRSVLVPGAKAPLLGVVQPGPELFRGIQLCITETAREPGYRSPMAERHSSAGARAPWAERLSDAEVQALATRVLCPAPLDFPPSAADEFLSILLTRAHPYTAWDIAGHECRGRAINSRTNHVLRLATDRGLNVGGLERPAELDARLVKLSERLVLESLRRSLQGGGAERTRNLVNAINRGAWDAALSAFDDRAPDAAGAKVLRRVLITERTAAWLPRLERDLATANAVVVVDIAHLGGEGGLIQLLTDRGFRVNRSSVPAEHT